MSLFIWLISLILGFLGFSSTTITTTPSTPTVGPSDYELRALSVGDLSIRVPFPPSASDPVETTAEVDGCDVPEADIDVSEAPGIRFVQVPSNCALEARAPGNGFYGYFRTIADIPDAGSVTRVDTPIGQAEIVSYPYYECTNSCTNGSIQVAIITLQSPPDPTLPTLQIFQATLLSNGDERSFDLAAYVSEIRPG